MKSHSLKSVVSLIGLTSIIFASNIAYASIEKSYSLKGPRQTGTNIQPIIATSKVSFNKNFSDLSHQEKEIFKSRYIGLGKNDTPPFPTLGLKKIYKPIVTANNKIQATGSLQLTANVNVNGFVESIEVLNTPDEELTAIAEKVLLSTKFDPASCEGVACEMPFRLEINLK